MVNVFKGIVEEVKRAGRGAAAKIMPETIKKVFRDRNLKVDMSKLIVEFKGGGIISPNVGSKITYEVNPSLIE